ncbi:hypothetical protein [Ferruginibacter sp. SUN106]|uniref:hypothetical protein n=1 Tax=Ferruginibacter sp. SUN106 TaxID=2978348 RepID=UPI003D363D11
MKKIIVLLALSLAVGSFSFGQGITQQPPQKMEHSGVQQNKKDKKTKYEKHKHKHKHKHMKHTKKHKK